MRDIIKNIQKRILHPASLVFPLSSFYVNAQDPEDEFSRDITNPALRREIRFFKGEEFFSKFLPNLITLGFIIASIALFFTLLIGGIEWITSGGDKTKLESARGRITNALVGFFIVASIFAIIKVIENLLGIDILRIDIAGLKIGGQPQNGDSCPRPGLPCWP